MASTENLIKTVVQKKFLRIDKECITPLKDIGSGAFGSVCTAKDATRDAVVAAKILKIPDKLSEQKIKELIREVEVMNSIIDEHIIDIYGVCIDINLPEPIYCIILPYMENGSIKGLFEDLHFVNEDSEKHLTLPWSLRTRMLYQVASGMTYLHYNKILHLDLKASNILLNEDLHIKIADFGLSRWYSESSCSDKLGGTVTHMPPEYFKNANKKPNTDFDTYSYGILIWEVLSGSEPYKNCRNHEQLIACVKDGNRPDLEEIPKDIPLEYAINSTIIPLMKECWDADPSKRKNMAGIKGILNQLYDEKTKIQAQREMPPFLGELHKRKKKVSTSNSLSNITEDLQNMKLQDYVATRVFTRDRCSQPVNPVAHQEASINPVGLQHVMSRQHQNPETEEKSEGSLQRHVHAHPSSAVQSIIDKDACSNEWEQSNNSHKKLNTGRTRFPNDAFDSSEPGGTTNVVTYNISGNSNVHIGPSFHIHNAGDNQRNKVKINESPSLNENNIHIEDLKGSVSDEHISKICRELGKDYWRILARNCLLFKDGELDALAHDFSYDGGQIETIYQMFRQWKQKYGEKATREWLATGFVYINRKDLIDILRT